MRPHWRKAQVRHLEAERRVPSGHLVSETPAQHRTQLPRARGNWEWGM